MISIERIVQIILVLVSSGYFLDILGKNVDNNYGPYKIEFTSVEQCVGPKSRNLTDLIIDMSKDGEEYFLRFNFTFFTQCHLDEVRIKTYTVKEHQKSLILNYHINDPCHHFSMASILEKYFEAKKCSFKKDNYDINLNMTNSTRMFFGKTFFYGDFMVKSIATSKQGNIACMVLNFIISKDK